MFDDFFALTIAKFRIGVHTICEGSENVSNYFRLFATHSILLTKVMELYKKEDLNQKLEDLC